MKLLVDKNDLLSLFGKPPIQINPDTYLYEKTNDKGYLFSLHINFAEAVIFFELKKINFDLPFYKITVENVSHLEIIMHKVPHLIIRQNSSGQICAIYFPSFHYTIDDEEGLKFRNPFIEEWLI